MQKFLKITETMANGYSSESTRRELSNENQHDIVSMVFINLCNLVHWTKVALATNLHIECTHGLTTLNPTHQLMKCSKKLRRRILKANGNNRFQSNIFQNITFSSSYF